MISKIFDLALTTRLFSNLKAINSLLNFLLFILKELTRNPLTIKNQALSCSRRFDKKTSKILFFLIYWAFCENLISQIYVVKTYRKKLKNIRLLLAFAQIVTNWTGFLLQ